MATKETNGLMSVKDAAGNLYIIYPITKLENITDLEAATTSTDGLMTKGDKSKLDGIAAGAQKNTVTGIKGNAESAYRTGNINITPANIGLGNVNNTADSAKTVASAAKLTTARTIDGVSFNGTAAITHYGTCSTAAATAAKTVTCTGFSLVTGAEITVRFGVTNTAANPTLNVNSTGAKPIYYRNTAISAGYLTATRTYKFVYDGTAYQLIGDLDTDTKYSNMTAATASAAGKAGLVPAPAAGKQGQFLRGDGTWASPANTTYAVATESANGLMSAADKAKLNKITCVIGKDDIGYYIEDI